MAQGPNIGIKMGDNERSKSRTSRLRSTCITYFEINKLLVSTLFIYSSDSKQLSFPSRALRRIVFPVRYGLGLCIRRTLGLRVGLLCPVAAISVLCVAIV